MFVAAHLLHCLTAYKSGPFIVEIFEDFVETVLKGMPYLIVVSQDLLNGCREKVARVKFILSNALIRNHQEYTFVTCKAVPRCEHLLQAGTNFYQLCLARLYPYLSELLVQCKCVLSVCGSSGTILDTGEGDGQDGVQQAPEKITTMVAISRKVICCQASLAKTLSYEL